MRIPSDEQITVTVTASDFEFTWTGYADNVTDALAHAQNEWDEQRAASE